MRFRRRTQRGWLSLCICFAWVSCQQQSADEVAREAGEEEGLRPVALPNLDAFAESAREQLESQYGLLQTLADRRESNRTSLGEAYGFMGQLLLAYELTHAAEPALLNATDLLPLDVRWPYYLGYLYKAVGELELASRYYEQALATQSTIVPIRIHLASVYIDLGQDADAKALLEKALHLDPESAAAHLLLGHLAARDRPREAIAHYETVLRMQPSASEVRYPLALLYQKLGNLDRSRQHLAQRGNGNVDMRDPLVEELRRLRKGAGAKIVEANRLKTEGRYREAAALYREAAAEDSTNVTAYLNLAVAVAQLGDIEAAIQALERVLRLDPSHSNAHYNLGYLLGLQGKEQKALEHFEAAVDADSGNSVARLALANLLWRKRQCQEAINHYDKVLATNLADLEARMNKAVCHAHLGDYAEAHKLLEAGHEAFPQQPILQDALIRILSASPDARVRDGDRAVKMAERQAAAKRRPETLEVLAMAYAEVGRFPDAIRYQEEVIRAVEQQVPPTLLDHLQRVLRRYEQGKPSRTPWPPTVFDR